MRIAQFILAMYLNLCVVPITFATISPPLDLVPPDLNPGDEFRLIFYTSTTFNSCARSTSVADIATFVQNTVANSTNASVRAISGWQAMYIRDDGITVTNTIASSGSIFNNNVDDPIYRLDLLRVVANRADLFDGTKELDNPILVDENLNVGVSPFVFTGFNHLEQAVNTLGTGGICRFGRSAFVGNTWASFMNGPPSDSRSMYVMSPVLTVPQPVSVSSSGLQWD